MILFYDTETSGFVNKGKPASDPSQPHLVQLAAVLTDDEGNDLSYVSMIVKPDGWSIPAGAAAVHKITTEKAMKVGVPLRVVLACFTNLRALADMTVAHNIDFDALMMACAIAQAKAVPAHPGPTKHACTMKSSVNYCRMPPTLNMSKAGYGTKFKPPKLEELYQFLFKETFAGAHDAMNDVRACKRSFFELRKRARALTLAGDLSTDEMEWPSETRNV